MSNHRASALNLGATAMIVGSVLLATAAGGCRTHRAEGAEGTHLYMDVHELGAGKVTAAAVAQAHTADLGAQGRHGVQFLHYWVDEQRGTVYCLSRAASADAIVATHREAHGLLHATVAQVSDGE